MHTVPREDITGTLHLVRTQHTLYCREDITRYTASRECVMSSRHTLYLVEDTTRHCSLVRCPQRGTLYLVEDITRGTASREDSTQTVQCVRTQHDTAVSCYDSTHECTLVR